ncbi:hypothetical protein CJ030_MR0G020849 [Morella rubra]|uniref:Uncharacterized protein n=1 Tax=Morella rubra TaxID=262757 RepID=A0A6A1UH11_9ROSI|nr:hypothetical protein CJ030_MR0G020849 [Morella rubra]
MYYYEIDTYLDAGLYVVVLKVRVWIFEDFQVIVEHEPHCGSLSSVAEDGDSQVKPKTVEYDKKLGYKIFPRQNDYNKINVNRIRETLKRKRYNAAISVKHVDSINAEMDSEAWIEIELENRIELEYSSLAKKQRKDVVSF